MKFRCLTADEVECRVATVGEKGASLLLYKDARCDMRILDESGVLWQRRHYECKGNLFCSVGIKVGEEWVWKDDCGSESRTEKEKGEASDSFKRACFNWGIGRELYTAPFIWLPADRIKLEQYNGKWTTTDRFCVDALVVEDGKIVGLEISNAKTKASVFTWGKSLPAHVCARCGRAVGDRVAARSIQVNDGVVFCSAACVEAGHGENA